MRKRFDIQYCVGARPIDEVYIPLKTRDELPPVLTALQYIFKTPDINSRIFELLENVVCVRSKKTGRPGMDLWHILVLAVVRHATGADWDRLHTDANFNQLIRGIMGVYNIAFDYGDDRFVEFERQTIIDNVSLIDEATLFKINEIVTEAAHLQMFKKKEDLVLELKTDSYVLETNVHFPTDLNLLWDSCRKNLDMVGKLQQLGGKVEGWRKLKDNRRNIKSIFRATSHQVFKGRNEKQKKAAVTEYIEAASKLEKRCKELISKPPMPKSGTKKDAEKVIEIIENMKEYCRYTLLFVEQIDRRLLKGETIPAEEKVYSIFEPHTEWITKGKTNKKVELGHMVLVTTDQYGLIVDYKVMEKERDAAQLKPLTDRIAKKYPQAKVASHSFDKGFFSYDNLEYLEKASVVTPVLPKKGKHNKNDKARESQPIFKKMRNKHSAIESNINMLEHHGLDRCPDKGIKNYKRYVGMSVLAYNLHRLGNMLCKAERVKLAAALRAPLKQAA